MKLVRPLSLLSLALLGLFALAGRASAQQTFAYWGENSPAASDFTFTDNGVNSVLTGTDSDVFLDIVNGQDAGQNFTASLTLTGVAGPGAITIPPGGTAFAVLQPLSSLTETFTEIGGSNPGADLLTVNIGSTADLSGNVQAFGNDGETATYSNSESATPYFSSSILDFTGIGTEGATLDLNSITPTISLGADGYLNTFTATGGGDFSESAAPAPEATTAVSFGTAIALLLGIVLYRKKQSTTTA